MAAAHWWNTTGQYQQGSSSGSGATVRTQAGARRYHQPIGSLIGRKPVGKRDATPEQAHAIQHQLHRVGLLDHAQVDGKFGPVTEQAVRRFQRRHGLIVSGKVDAATMRLLHVAGDARENRRITREADQIQAQQRRDRRRSLPPPTEGVGPKPGTKAMPMLPGPDPVPPRRVEPPKVAPELVAERHQMAGTRPVPGRAGGPTLDEEYVPATTGTGAALIDFTPERAIYSDGSVFDGFGWQPGHPAKAGGDDEPTGDPGQPSEAG